MENTKISVIIPNWNGAKTLKACIESCLNQTLKPLEILVCDDGSTDESKQIVEQINNTGVIWIPSLHSGTPAIPRNNGMKKSSGEWIAFCDNDDEWLPTKLEKQILLVTTLRYKASCTNAFNKINNVITSNKVSSWKKNTISFKNLLQSNDIVCSSVIIHSSIFNEINGFTEIVEYGSFADYIYWLRVATKTNFAFVNEPLVIYDDHPQTSLRKEQISDIQLKKNSFENFIKWSKESKNNILRMACFRFYIKKYKVNQKIKMFVKQFLFIK